MKIPFLHYLEKFLRKNKRKVKKLEQRVKRLEITEKKIMDFDFAGLIKTYDMLSDDFSRKIFIDVLKYRLSYADGILPPIFIGNEKELEEIFNKGQYAKGTYFDKTNLWEVGKFDLNFLNRKIYLYTATWYIFSELHLKQYEYHQNDISIGVQSGNYVIDGGGCWADLALFFADDIGKTGQVFSFECSPNNLKIWHKNMDLNPELKSRIQLIDRALWSNSNDILHLTDNDGASACSLDPSPNTAETRTIAIDDFMMENNVPQMDFIKLDIEGAELECLRGAQNTIQKFKPNLAISVYHKDEDMVTIPQYIKLLVPEYKLYLKHHTDGFSETVLYATKDDPHA